MPNVSTLRPTATTFSGGWTPSTGSLHGVTSDDSDATYATWAADSQEMVLSVGADTLPAGNRRHRARVRIRGEDGDVYFAVRRPNGSFAAYGSASLPDTPTSFDGSWGTGMPETQAGAFGVLVNSQGAVDVRVQELWVDIDSRAAPTFDVDLLDGSGNPETALTDTNAPTVSISNTDYDDLPPRQWRAWVTSGGATIWDTGTIGGAPSDVNVEPLQNGTYVLHAQIWSTLGFDSEFPSAEQTINFTVNVAPVVGPTTVTVTQVPNSPFYEVVTCAPDDLSDYDDSEAYVQLQREDCSGVTTLEIRGPVTPGLCVSYFDWTVPVSIPEACEDPADECTVTWRARFVGTVDGSRVTSPWTESDTVTLYAWDDAGDEEGWVGEGSATVRQTTTPYGFDGYGRVEANTFGTADSGETYTDGGGVASNYSVNGSYGIHTLTTTNASRRSAIPSSLADIDVYVDIATSALATGGSLFGCLMGRMADVDNMYMARLDFTTSAGITITLRKRLSAAETQLDSLNTGLTHVAGTFYRVHLQIIGSDIKARVWPVSSAEPVTWQVEATDTDLTAAGNIGPRSVSAMSNTNTNPEIRYDNLLLTDPFTYGVAHDGAGSLEASDTFSAGFDEVRFNDAAPLRDLSANGPVLKAWVLVPSDAPGTDWLARLELQDPSFTWIPGPNFPITPGVWTEITYQPSPTLLSNCRSIGFAISGVDVDQVQGVFVDTVRQSQEDTVLEWIAGEHLLRAQTPDGPVFASACGQIDWGVDRPFTVATGVVGGQQVTSGEPGGRDFNITLSVPNEDQLATVEEILTSPLILVTPSDSPQGWAAPKSTDVEFIKVGRIRRVKSAMTGTGPEPEPIVSDVEV